MPAETVGFGYFDTSVLVKCYVAESGTPAALRFLRRHAVLSSALAPVEFASALRQHRERNALEEDEFERIESKVHEERPYWTLLAVDSIVLERAEALTRAIAVRTLDALHLASALVFQGETGLQVPFITADEQQRRAGTVLGLDVAFVK